MTNSNAFELLLPRDVRSPVVLDSPHSGTQYPEDFRPAASLDALRRAEDSYVDELFRCGPRYGATLITARFPRSYIDANRSLLDIDASLLESTWPGPAAASRKTELGIGLVWRILDTGEPIYSRKLTVEELRRRIIHFHQPYQKAVRDSLDAIHSHFGVVWHLNCHSMPARSSVISEEGPGVARPDFVLGDRDGSTCDPLFTRFVAEAISDMGYQVKINDPYKGAELVRAFSDPDAGRHSLQLEINRRLYMDEHSREKTAGFARVTRDIERLIKAVCTFAGERGSHQCHRDRLHNDCEHDHEHGHRHENIHSVSGGFEHKQKAKN